ncbi:MAG: hypothetical protein AB7V14_00170 [Kiritimatiellia bacterium]
MKSFLLAAAILFGLFLALPLVQMGTGWPPDCPLDGWEKPIPPPKLDFRAWGGGNLQSQFEVWFSRHVGLRGWLVRTANQINFALFRELKVYNSGTRVLMGRNEFLFAQDYVDAYARPGLQPTDKLRELSASVRRAQDGLAANGIAFLLLIAPSKAEIYPEFLPTVADVAGRSSRRSDYDNLIGFLRRNGVNLIDGHERFLEWKNQPGVPALFTQGGIHWNHYGATRMAGLVMERLRDLTGKDLSTLQVVGSETNDVVVAKDNDLGDLVNLWPGHPRPGPQIHPLVEHRAGTYLPDVLFVGDSFVPTLTVHMDGQELYRRRNTYYYYNRDESYPEAKSVVLDKKSLDLKGELQGRDAVVVEVNEAWISKMGFGFIEDLVQVCETAPGAP